MKMATALVPLFVLVVGQFPHAEQSSVSHPHWVIIATIIDRTTGKPVGEVRLGGLELEFDDSRKCKSIAERVHTVPTAHTTAVLTCRKVEASHSPEPIRPFRYVISAYIHDQS
jgi:hypothetical protein